MTDRKKRTHTSPILLLSILLPALLWLSGCNTTRHLQEGEYLLRSNSLKLKSDRSVTHRGELVDQLNSLIMQKPNTYLIDIGGLSLFPYKLWLYNLRYKQYQNNPANYQLESKTVEKPVIYDSSMTRRSAVNMKSLMFNQGYFYARVTDTTLFKNRKAYVQYHIESGPNYLIRNHIMDADDSTIQTILQRSMEASALVKGEPYSDYLAEQERSRLANVLRNHGYYKISQEQISFELDTLNKAYLRDAENPFESAINFVAQQNQNKRPTLDVRIIVRTDDPTVYERYGIGRILVLPDFVSGSRLRDSTVITREFMGMEFRYNRYYIREDVLYKRIYLREGNLYAQEDYDRTISNLNDLGLFQYVRIYTSIDSTAPPERALRCTILMHPTKRFDYSNNLEVSSSTSYPVGNAVSVSFRNRNLGRGGNQLSLTASAGIELGYDSLKNQAFVDRFFLQSRNLSLYGTLDMPRFLAPVPQNRINSINLPRTVLGLGTSLLDRVNYFTLINTQTSLSYRWNQTQTRSWSVTPAFINIIRLPYVAKQFQERLQQPQYEFLRNIYAENFIEGENVTFVYNDQDAPSARFGYSFVKLALEEAGGLLSLVHNTTGTLSGKGDKLPFAQYVKLDVDARHYFNIHRSVLAVRFNGGLGIPYGASRSLPYVKQYFVGGAYSIRGWRVRTLGPGSYYSPADTNSALNFIDRTGDIKLESSMEYRFPVVQLFSGALKLNGAVFADAGNIWLANKSDSLKNGEFAFHKLGRDLAVSTGAGARLDIGGFFIIRFDAAFPVKRPYLPGQEIWLFNHIDPLDPQWRARNLILNIAIGYPF